MDTATFGEQTSRHRWLLIHRIRTGLVQSHRVEGSKHPNVRYNGNVILPMAITVGRYIDDQADVEMGAPVQHGPSVLDNFFVQNLVGFIPAALIASTAQTPIQRPQPAQT